MFVAPRTEISWPVLAAETSAPYAVGAESRTSGWLDEVAGIAERRDRQMGRLVGLLVAASRADDLAEVTGGMSLHVWLQHQVRCTHAEARDVLGAVEMLASHARDVGGAGRPVAVVVADIRDLPCCPAGAGWAAGRAGPAGGRGDGGPP